MFIKYLDSFYKVSGDLSRFISMNHVQEAIYVGSREESGIWEVLNDVTTSLGVTRENAFLLIKNELSFISSRNDIFLIKSQQLYETDGSAVMDASKLADLTLDDVEFKEAGPFYFSNLPTI